jgi:hypothetical protein
MRDSIPKHRMTSIYGILSGTWAVRSAKIVICCYEAHCIAIVLTKLYSAVLRFCLHIQLLCVRFVSLCLHILLSRKRFCLHIQLLCCRFVSLCLHILLSRKRFCLHIQLSCDLFSCTYLRLVSCCAYAFVYIFSYGASAFVYIYTISLAIAIWQSRQVGCQLANIEGATCPRTYMVYIP